ncbi:MAG TPA: baseplate protein J, partial [Cyanobacteria bacterium UBA11366]|nr:baseplate protein J [Cyanobacteria bacterium UBA11366]
EQRNLESTDKQAEFPGHISLVIVPDNQQVKSEKITELNQNLKTWLTPRTLLTTRLHIVPPNYVEFKIAADLYLEDGADRYTVETNAINAINTFYHPLNSSPDWDGKGWPFGRNIYVSEIYALLDKISGIDYVKNVKIYLPNQTNEDKSNTCITVEDYQLVSVIIDENSFTFKDRFGNEWQ